MLTHSRFGQPTLVERLETNSNRSGSTCKPLFAKPYEFPFTTVGIPRLLKKTSGFVSQSALPGFGWIFFKLNNFATSCHLQNGKTFNVSVVVLAASETQLNNLPDL